MGYIDTFFIGDYEYRYDIKHRIDRCFQTAINDHCKVYVVRLDVRFPPGFLHNGNNSNVSELLRRMKLYYAYHRIDCRYVWVMERKSSEVPHNHLLLLFDGSRLESGWGVRTYAARIWERLLGVKCDADIHLCEPDGGGSGITIRRPTREAEGEKFQIELAQFDAACRAALQWAGYLAKTRSKGSAPLGVKEFSSSQF